MLRYYDGFYAGVLLLIPVNPKIVLLVSIRQMKRHSVNYGMHMETMNRFLHLERLVGNTPMLVLKYVYKGKPGRIFVKCEQYNLTGSVKDRMVLNILKNAYLRGAIRPGDEFVEATSGNTGISLAAMGRALGHPVHIIMPDWLSTERFEIIRSYGTTVTKISKDEGGFLRSIELAKDMARSGTVFLPCQFDNPDNPSAHEHTTAPEIIDQLQTIGVEPDAVVAGVGTGGTIMGIGRGIRKHYPSALIHPLEPAESPTLSTGYKVGEHRIQGISDEFIPRIVQLNELDDIIRVHDGDAIITAQKLAVQAGLGVGISSGANVAGAVRLQQELGPEAVVVTLLCDSNKKYLSTALTRDEPSMPHHVSSALEFTGYDTILSENNTFTENSRL
jgi:cysteine synthase A